ncbi:MAG: hypothetical protein JRG91_12725 [Deltaproteobacteria bacterium]|nr:hypothetical protein [Deltaproteobacteria bacterium]
MLVCVALTWADPAGAGVRGDSGWSADGRAWGLCEAWILPDSRAGCRFHDRESRVWVEIGRREAIALWRPWEPALVPSGTPPIIPVYPMQEQEDNPGPVSLSGRLNDTDDVVALWSLEGDVTHGDRGGEWSTIFDYSPDGIWLAVGAVHVDHETSRNEFFVEVRPVTEWLALAHVRAALDKLSQGRIRAGLASMARARGHLEASSQSARAATPRSPDSPLKAGLYLDEDPLHEKTFARWSRDGSTLCICEAWRGTGGENKSRCRTLTPPGEEWKPVLVNLVYTVCPGYGRPAAPPPAPLPFHFWADGGFDGTSGAVGVYMTGGDLGPALGAVVERDWDEPLEQRFAYPTYFHEVGLPSPDGRWLAIGFLEEEGIEGGRLRYEVEVGRVADWVEKAQAEIELHARSDPPTIDDARPALDLPVEQGKPLPPSPPPAGGGSGCALILP